MNANHDIPVGCCAAGQPATYLTMHGTEAEIGVLATAIQQRRTVLTVLGPLACEPEFGCHHLHLVVLGTFAPGDLHTIVVGLGLTSIAMTAHLN
jgi:hypothetical protein